jgi:hypothetical protein
VSATNIKHGANDMTKTNALTYRQTVEILKGSHVWVCGTIKWDRLACDARLTASQVDALVASRDEIEAEVARDMGISRQQNQMVAKARAELAAQPVTTYPRDGYSRGYEPSDGEY